MGQRLIRCLAHALCAPDVAKLVFGKCHDCGHPWDFQTVEGDQVASGLHYCDKPFDLEAAQ